MAGTLTPSTYRAGVSVRFLPMLMPGVVSSVVAAVLVGLCTAPTLSL